ncbi:putative UAA transporter family [Trypanosoma cruzi]|nr:putative UAA transporter family [Trypanosoma cruzi]
MKSTNGASSKKPGADTQQKNRPEKPKREASGSRKGPSPPLSVIFVMFQIVFCVSGIYVCFGLWSIKQERVVTKPYRAVRADGEHAEMAKLSTVFVLGLIQAIAGTLVGALLLLVEKMYSMYVAHSAGTGSVGKMSKAGRLAAFRMTAVMGFTNAFGSSLSYAAMRRLPYPVVLATKMSKMVPVMLVGFFWHGTRYSFSKCAACAITTGGVFFFYLLGEKHSRHEETQQHDGAALSSWLGFLLLFFSLLTDGFTNSTQDVLVKRLGWGGNRLMFYTNLATGTWLLLVLLALEALHPLAVVILEAEELTSTALSSTSPIASALLSLDTGLRWYLREVAPLKDLSRTWHFFQRYPEALKDVLEMSFLNATGQVFIFRVISFFGSLTLTAITLLRKSGSVLLSVVVHGHQVAIGQWIALLVAFAGVVWEALMHVRKAPSAPRSSLGAGNKKPAGSHGEEESDMPAPASATQGNTTRRRGREKNAKAEA